VRAHDQQQVSHVNVHGLLTFYFRDCGRARAREGVHSSDYAHGHVGPLSVTVP
jgi:hypothetical protein